MDGLWSALFDSDFMPHGHCYLWQPAVLWLNVAADAVIALAYYSIPTSLTIFRRRRPDMEFSWMLGLFVAFIFACGTTHVMAIWTVWRPVYGVETLVKVATAAISIVAAVLLVRILPRVLALPSLTALETANAALAAEVDRRTHAEERYRTLLESAPDGMVICDADGRITFANTQAESLFAVPRAELVGQNVEVLIPGRLRDLHVDHRTAYLREPRLRPMGAGLSLRARRRDGSEFPVEISLSPLQTEEGVLVSGAIRDVTERKKADELRARLAAIVDSSDDAVVGKTLDGTMTSWNRGAERIFGYTADETVGKPISMLLPPGRLGEEPEIMKRLKRGERVEPFETVRRTKNGRDIDVSVTISPIHDSRGQVIGASKVARDISDRKRAELALARAKEAAETASREFEAFSYSVAHDLRAPLRGIDGFSQALIEDYADKLDAEGRRQLGKVRESAQHMAQLIENLLMLARVTQSDLRRERVDLSALARTAGARLQSAHSSRQVELRITEDLVGDGDGRLLGIVFDNLLGNSWKFTGKRPVAHIEFGSELLEEGQRVFFVRDDGAGFDMAYQTKLFGVFQRLHAPKEFDGIGIGLATVQRIIRRHGGRVWAKGAVDQGAVFYFTLGDKEQAT